jgi:hypothetical protein
MRLMTINPYQSPQVVDEPVKAPPGALYTSGHVAWATFLSGPIGGCVLLALKYWRLGESKSAWLTILGGCVATAALLAVAFLLPDGFPSFLVSVASVVAMAKLAGSLQGESVTQHLANGGRKGSAWVATGLGILSGLVLVVAVLGMLMILPESWFGAE